MLIKKQGATLLKLARKAIEQALDKKTVKVSAATRAQFPHQPVFVTILKDGELRGSMGYADTTYPLVDGVVDSARDAAFKDPRFKPVRRSELAKLRLRIDILSNFKPSSVRKIKPGGQGIYVECGPFKGLLLPEDARKFKWTASQMVENAVRSAGLAPEMAKSRNVKIYAFTTKTFRD